MMLNSPLHLNLSWRRRLSPAATEHMKCPKCGKEMELLFVNYKCYYCNPPKGRQMTLDLDIKTLKESDEGILGEETGWEGYAD